MRHTGTTAWVDAEEVKKAATRVGLHRLQQYLDHLTRTRAYNWWEARPLTEAERSSLAERIGEENLDYCEQFATGLTYRKVEPLRGDKLHDYLSTVDLVALVQEMPFERWCKEERRRLRRDAQLLTNWARLWGIIAAATLQRAQTAYVAWQNYTSNRDLPDWQEAQLRRARYGSVQTLYSAANDERQTAKQASSKAASTRSAAGRLSGVEPRDLALLGIALEAFICREFTPTLSSVDSVAMLFLTWVDAETISCASPKCTQRFLRPSAHRGRPSEYCSPTCKMAAYRAREESARVA